jgi:CubicO group peptidase (beta-lactamase class C family)
VVLAVVSTVVMLAVGSRLLWRAFTPTTPVHKDAAAVPSTEAAAPSDRHARPVEESRRLARALVAGDDLPGISVAVAVDGEIVWAEGFGWFDAESRAPVTPLTRFRLGALSKSVSAFAVALLHDRGRLDLDAPVQSKLMTQDLKLRHTELEAL